MCVFVCVLRETNSTYKESCCELFLPSSVEVAYRTIFKFKPSTHTCTLHQTQTPNNLSVMAAVYRWIIKYKWIYWIATHPPLPPSLKHKHTLSMTVTLGWEWGCLSLSCKGISEMMLATYSHSS